MPLSRSAAAAVVVVRRQTEAGGVQRAAAGEAAAGQARAAAEKLVAARAAILEKEARTAAAIPQLRAALGDGVDSATILDLFDSEDWWAPFRNRSAALVAEDRILAMRGERQLPHPGGALLARAHDSGIATALLMGSRPVVVALVPMSVPRNAEPTFLMFASPIEAGELQAAVGTPIALSDGHAVVGTAGGGPEQQAALSGLAGRESLGSVRDPGGAWLAEAVPLSPKIWLWTLQGAAASSGLAPPWLPIGLGAGALLLGLSRPGPRARGAALRGHDRRDDGGRGGPRRRGTRSYDTDEIAQRAPMPDNDVAPQAPYNPRPATARVAAGGGGAMPQAERARLETTSSTFGRYRLLERLGEGGMAEIYTAVLHGAEGFRRVFVVKRLRPHCRAQPRRRGAVHRRGQARLVAWCTRTSSRCSTSARSATSTSWPRSTSSGATSPASCSATWSGWASRWTSGWSSTSPTRCWTRWPTPTTRPTTPAARWALVHRDISPGNIMVTARGEVKLFDFGIVKAEGRVSKTEVGVVKGNVSFMSPEQARGLPVDSRSDLFSLGLVMYYALTNDALYPGDSTFEQLMKAASGPRTEHLQRVKLLPAVSASLLARALAVDPALRYQNAADFEAELVPHVTGARAEATALMQRLFGPEFRREATV